MEPVVTVEQGRLRGFAIGEVAAFLGVPYAQPPFGALRFQAPVVAAAWAGIRDAVAYGPTVPKPPYAAPVDALLPEPVIPGDDCLNLNVWAPAVSLTGGASLPVLVWIHGGAFVNGSGAVPMYDGSSFARDGIVCVTINYRLGVDGFGAVDSAPANRGLLDQIAALTWVRDNIAAFGGNPGGVTVAGESAGAMSVATLMALPAARGLFRRAILQSGGGHHVLTAATAAKVTAEIAARLGVEPTVEGLSSVEVPQLVATQSEVAAFIAGTPDPARWAEITVNSMAFEPVVDGRLLTRRPIDGIAAGGAADVDVLIGTNTDEHALFLVPNGFASMVDDALLRRLLAGLGADVDKLLSSYRSDRPTGTAGELLIAILSDWFFRIPAVRIAEARAEVAAGTFMYEFGWPSPRFDGRLGACHALEIGFTFDNLADPAGVPLAGEAPPQALASDMHASWVGFVADGHPGWPAYGADRTVRHFGGFGGSSDLVHDPRREQREVWDGIR
jgi:para-nitrobenzyl esterase